MKLEPNLEAAHAFLDALDPDGTFFFQTFDDGPGKRSSLARIFAGTLVQHASELQRLNQQGAGVYVMVNEGVERKNAGVTRIRSYFVDLDGAPAGPLMNASLPADILVESSPDKYHGYWLTQEGSLELFKARQHALAAHFGGDPSVCDLARVMRLPGFHHRKTDQPHMVKLLRCSRPA